MNKKIIIDSTVKSLGIKIGVMCFLVENKPMIDEKYVQRFEQILKNIEKKLIETIKSAENLKDHPIITAYRKFYWKIGVDPTKIRPAGEALARRLLLGKKINPIDPIVDSGNLASIDTFISIGLYDLEKLPTDLVLGLSKGGEVFYPIGKNEEILVEGLPILRSNDIVVHLYPHRDSRLSCIDINSKNIIGISAGVPGVPDELLESSLKKILDYMDKLGITYKVLVYPIVI